MFHLPIPANGVPDGHSKDKPLRLEGIEKTDFKQLLRVMYPRSVDRLSNKSNELIARPIRRRNFGREETLTAPEWMSVLKLSSMWEFGEIRKLAIRRLSQLTIDAVEKVVIARDYHIAEWLIPSINVLAQRKKPMGVLDVNRLGWDYVLKIGEVRESFSAGANCNGYCRYCSNYDPLGGGSVSRENHNFMDVIQRVFEMDP
jgi:hypothetical protein